MLVRCAATSISRQSCTNRPGICRTSGWRWALIFEVGRLFEIGRQFSNHQASDCPIIEYYQGHRPIPQLAGRCPQSADRRPMPDRYSRCPDYLLMLLRLKKIREGVGNVYLGPTVHRLPIGDLDGRPTHPIILRSSFEKAFFRPKNPSYRHRRLM